MTKTKSDKIQRLISDLWYQHARGVHTYSFCETHNLSGRGGQCVGCVLDQMVELIPLERALLLNEQIGRMIQLELDLIEMVKEEENRDAKIPSKTSSC